jgi:uncharacterized protein (TIGR03790 family)
VQALARAFLVLAVLAVGSGGVAPARAAAPAAARVVVLANSDDADSLRLAHYYTEKRGVPAANIYAYKMSAAETIGWPEFVATIWQPLQDDLVRAGWIDAIPMDLVDPAGRRKYVIHGHRIAYLVVCRGVPLRIEANPAWAIEPAVVPLANRPEFATNQAAVDSELALLAESVHPTGRFVPNILFQNEAPTTFDAARVVKTTRLDGPTVEAARALVDHALTAERDGLLGRAYVDIGGIHEEGDRWLEEIARQLTELGFDTDVDREPMTLPGTARFDAPVLYFGWYAGDLNGPFALPGFRFPPGAIAQHIHSMSASTLRSARTGWCGPLVDRGVTGTLGNVYEPYLQILHRPTLFLRALARGATFGDAAYYSLPVLSWQSPRAGAADVGLRGFAEDAAARSRRAGRRGARARPGGTRGGAEPAVGAGRGRAAGPAGRCGGHGAHAGFRVASGIVHDRGVGADAGGGAAARNQRCAREGGGNLPAAVRSEGAAARFAGGVAARCGSRGDRRERSRAERGVGPGAR